MSATSGRPRVAPNASFRDEAHLIGELGSNGTASLQKDLSNTGDKVNPASMPNGKPESSSSSLSDGDLLEPDPELVVEGSTGGGIDGEGQLYNARYESLNTETHDSAQQPRPTRRRSVTVKLEKTGEDGRYYLSSEDPELQSLLKTTFERSGQGDSRKKRSKFSDIVFTRQFTAFDRQNPTSAASPFHGFSTLFWMSVGLLLIKVAANNWREYGSIFGKNEIVKLMMSKDVVLLGITDGVMCASTVFSLGLQKLVLHDWISWDRVGWIIQHIWQTSYLAGFIGFARLRQWPWTHAVFTVLHCITMLMKQHSYAFYNGHLSEVYKQKTKLEARLRHLEDSDAFSPESPTSSTTPVVTSASSYFDTSDLNNLNRRRKSGTEVPNDAKNLDQDVSNVTAAIEKGTSLDLGQIRSLRRLMKWEIDRLSEELKGKCTVTKNYYPRNLNLVDFYGYIPLPTVVYELEYPRQDSINWYYVAEKSAATFGVIGVMIVISTAFIYPVVVQTVRMKENGVPLNERLLEFPWVFMDLLFPLLMEQLLSWYVIWECVLNVLAELTRFADRGFYADWWNSRSWDYYARAWNIPVHNFLLRHAYHSSISAFKLSRPSATLVTFLLSACVHELVMMVIFGKIRGYLFALQMLQLPLVALSRSPLLKGRDTLGNAIFWLGLAAGPGALVTLYLLA